MANSKYKAKIAAREKEERRLAILAAKAKDKPKPAAAKVAPPVQQDFLAARAASERQGQLAVVQALIDKLPTAIFDPEGSAGEIYSRIRRLKMKPSVDTDAIITEGRLSAHALKIGGLVADLPTHEKPDAILALITTSRGFLMASGQEAKAFKAVGVTDGAAFDAKVGAAYSTAKTAAEEKAVQQRVADVAKYLRELPSATQPDAKREELVHTLNALGDKQGQAFPPGVTTREEMDSVIKTAHEAGQARAEQVRLERLAAGARIQFQDFGEDNSWSFWRGKVDNPDKALAAIKETVNTVLGGDLTLLSAGRGGSNSTAAQIEERLDAKHTRAIDNAAYSLLNERGISAPTLSWVWDRKPALEEAKDAIAAMREPQKHLQRFEEDLSALRRDIKEADRVTVAQIKKDALENRAVRYAIVTQHFAAKDEEHGGMLAKTLAVVEAAGGLDKLDAAVGRAKLKAEEWSEIKTLLASSPAPTAAITSEPVQSVKANGHANGGTNGSDKPARVETAVPEAAQAPATPALPSRFTRRNDWPSFVARAGQGTIK